MVIQDVDCLIAFTYVVALERITGNEGRSVLTLQVFKASDVRLITGVAVDIVADTGKGNYESIGLAVRKDWKGDKVSGC